MSIDEPMCGVEHGIREILSAHKIEATDNLVAKLVEWDFSTANGYASACEIDSGGY